MYLKNKDMMYYCRKKTGSREDGKSVKTESRKARKKVQKFDD